MEEDITAIENEIRDLEVELGYETDNHVRSEIKKQIQLNRELLRKYKNGGAA